VAESLGGVGLAEGVSMGQQLLTQAIGVAATIVWCAVISYVLLKVLDAVLGLRVPEQQETEGLDLVEHGERAYTS
jgi:Amt family ammonium transporter